MVYDVLIYGAIPYDVKTIVGILFIMLYKTIDLPRYPDVDFLTYIFESHAWDGCANLYIDAEDPSNLITWDQCINKFTRIAASLRKLGIGKAGLGKDVVVIFSSNQVSTTWFQRSVDERLCIP